MTRIVRAEPRHAETLSGIALRAKAFWGYPEEWLAAWRGLLTLTPGYVTRTEVHCATDSDVIHGFHALERKGEDWELEHLWVDPDHMGRGTGRALLEHAATLAGNLGAERILIESDPNAEAFYKRMGAVRIGERQAPVLGIPRSLPLMMLAI